MSVPAVESVGAFDCWVLSFTPRLDAPATLRARYQLSLDIETGWSRKLKSLDGKLPDPVPIQRFAGVTFVTVAPKGVPLEFLPPWLEPGRIELKHYPVLELRKRTEGRDITVEASIRFEGIEELFVRQKWVQGESWWREYERHVNGHKDLVARRVDLKTMEDAVSAARAKTPKTLPKFQPSVGLRADPRLQVRVTIVAENPRLGEILDILRGATGLKLSLAPNLEDHDPDFGSVALKQAPAFTAMALVARTKLRDGKWEKTEDGYCLTGVSLAPRRPTTNTLVVFLLWLAPGLVILGLTGLYFRRRKAANAGTNVKQPPAAPAP